MSFTPLIPKHHIDIVRNNVRISNSSTLSVVMDCIAVMQPLHKTQLLNVRGKYHNDGYLNRTEFVQLKSIFDRYKNDILILKPDDVEYVTSVNGMYKELEDFEIEIANTAKKLNSGVSGYYGNGEIRKRSEAV